MEKRPNKVDTPTLTPEEAGVDVTKSTSGPPPVASVDPYIGKTIDGRYLLEAMLGEGGMGVVYRGKHKVIDKKVAVKVLRVDMAKNQEMTERFLQEAKAASSIGNPHIVDISDFGTLPDGSTYFVMEYLVGKSLTEAMNDARPVPVPRVLHIAKQIAAGLSSAHEAGIVHRDLKPDNVMLVTRGADKDFVKILDFGIAKVGGEGARLTRAGAIFGTPHYMSPEQAAGTEVDQRTDIYALGIILYEMASGKVPFDADNFMGILTQHMYKAPVPILALVPAPEIPPALDAIIQKCLTKKVDGRYATMGALLLDLEKLEKGATPDALGEMMARSGGFNIPADYFRSSGMPAPMPATPAGLRTRPVWLPMAVAGTLVGLILVGFVVNELRGSAQQSVITKDAAPSPPTSVAPSALVPPPPNAPPAAPVPHHVVVMVEPLSAKVTRDGNADNLNVAPGKKAVELDVNPGELAVLSVSAYGYKSAQQTVDGSLASLIIRLDPVAVPKSVKGKDKPVAPPVKKCDPSIEICTDPFAPTK